MKILLLGLSPTFVLSIILISTIYWIVILITWTDGSFTSYCTLTFFKFTFKRIVYLLILSWLDNFFVFGNLLTKCIKITSAFSLFFVIILSGFTGWIRLIFTSRALNAPLWFLRLLFNLFLYFRSIYSLRVILR